MGASELWQVSWYGEHIQRLLSAIIRQTDARLPPLYKIVSSAGLLPPRRATCRTGTELAPTRRPDPAVIVISVSSVSLAAGTWPSIKRLAGETRRVLFSLLRIYYNSIMTVTERKWWKEATVYQSKSSVWALADYCLSRTYAYTHLGSAPQLTLRRRSTTMRIMGTARCWVSMRKCRISTNSA